MGSSMENPTGGLPGSSIPGTTGGDAVLAQANGQGAAGALTGGALSGAGGGNSALALNNGDLNQLSWANEMGLINNALGTYGSLKNNNSGAGQIQTGY